MFAQFFACPEHMPESMHGPPLSVVVPLSVMLLASERPPSVLASPPSLSSPDSNVPKSCVHPATIAKHPQIPA
jgi:hypothetical protein